MKELEILLIAIFASVILFGLYEDGRLMEMDTQAEIAAKETYCMHIGGGETFCTKWLDRKN